VTWTEDPLTPEEQATWAKLPHAGPEPRRYQHGELMALVAREPLRNSRPRWHVSVSSPSRLPTWDELVGAAHALRPGVPMAIAVPPRSWWINVHPYCLHLWELDDNALIAQWREEARGDTPT
jgi:hypothetical protein